MSSQEIVMAAAGGSTAATYIEDVFSTYLYTGNGGVPISYPANTADPYSQSDGWFTRTGSVQTSPSYASNRQVVIRRNGVTVYDANTTSTSITVGSVTYTAQGYVGSTYGWAGDYANCFGVSSTDVTTNPITNGIDLAGKGGLVWIKRRNGAADHYLFDTVRGVDKALQSDTTAAQLNVAGNGVNPFNTNGFTVNGSLNRINQSASTYVSWTFRKQPKFFDVVSYTGDGNAGRTVPHNLGSVPGCIILKSTSNSAADWFVYHRSLGNTKALRLNLTDAASTGSGFWQNTTPTDTEFTVSSSTNAYGDSYIAYLFAYSAGGFGLTGTDSVISCGAFTTDGSGNATVSLGYEPQWLLVKDTVNATDWYVTDTMRGWANNSGYDDLALRPNLSAADYAGDYGYPTATGFYQTGLNASTQHIYIAIRRGPMKVPTSGTSVFTPVARTGTGSNATVNVGFPPDLVWETLRSGASLYGPYECDRLRGSNYYLTSTSTTVEASAGGLISFDAPTGNFVGNNTVWEGSGNPISNWAFKRAPSFFDEVCYTGNGTAGRTITHNLGVAPEMMIVKARDYSGGRPWPVYHVAMGNGYFMYLNLTDASASNPWWNNTTPTASVFTVGSNSVVNFSGTNYVAYLFATCAGVSKVGSYTGNAALTTINCGFTGGARFVLIKRTDSPSAWYVWDSARGMVSGTDPSLSMNSTAGEINANSIYTIATGFQILASPSADVNTSGGTYIYLAIA